MKLRPYQQEQINQLRQKFKEGKKRVILCSPTGSGKTVVFTTIISGTIKKDLFNRVLVITDRIELFKQTWKSLRKLDIEPAIYNAKVKPKEVVTERVVVAMIETLKRRYKRYGKLPLGDFDLIIIDEAHKGNFKEVFKIYPNTRVIGATATPLASTKRDPLKNYYDDIVQTVDIPDLIEQGFLVDEHAFTMRVIDKKKLKKNNSGDYSESSQYEAFSERHVFKRLLENYKNKALGRKTIIFCPNIQMTEDVANQLKSAGYDDVFSLHSKSLENREDVLNKFHESDAGVMVNCGILTTGYDHPPIEVCIIYRATTSLPLWLQMVGRCSRISEGKTQMTVIDMGGNIDTLGMWSAPRNWSDYFWNPPKAGNPEPPPQKECPECGCMIGISVMECPSCGYEFETQPKETKDGILVEVKPIIGKKVSSLTLYELIQLERAKMIKSKFVWRVIRSTSEQWLQEYAKLTGKKRGWIYYQSKEGIGYTDYTITENMRAKRNG